MSSLAFDPLLPWSFVIGLAVLAVLAAALALARGLRGWAWRGADGLAAALALAGPALEAGARLGLNDYAGLDVKGKIVVTLRGYPKGLPSEEGAHLSATKGKIAEAHGGRIMLANRDGGGLVVTLVLPAAAPTAQKT